MRSVLLIGWRRQKTGPGNSATPPVCSPLPGGGSGKGDDCRQLVLGDFFVDQLSNGPIASPAKHDFESCVLSPPYAGCRCREDLGRG